MSTKRNPSDFTLWRPRKPEEFWNYPRDCELKRAIKRLKNGGPARLSIVIGDFSSGKTSFAYVCGMWASCNARRGPGLPCGECDACGYVLYGPGEHRNRFYEIDGSQDDVVQEVRSGFNNSGDPSIWDKLDFKPRLKGPGVVFVDEAHRLTSNQQDRLLKLTERNSDTKVIFATTRQEALDGGIVSRAGSAIYKLSVPTEDEAVTHLQRMAKEAGGFLEPTVAARIVARFGASPRVCLSALNELYAESPHIDDEVWQEIYGDDLDESEVVVTSGW